MLKKPVFNGFADYWYYARYLSREQRKIIYKSLPNQQKESLDQSYLKEGWSDLFYRNEVNQRLDELKEAYGYDVLEIRAKALKGKSVYVPTKFWQVVEEQMDKFKTEVTEFVMEGLQVGECIENDKVSLVIYDPAEKD
jgi:hypothetical protein